MIFIAPIAHIEFPKQNKSITEFKNELNREIEIIDLKLSDVRNKYDNERITAKEFIDKTDELRLQKISLSTNNALLIKEKVDIERVFGWKNLRIFLVGFGIRLPYLLFSVIISFLIFQFNTKNKNLQRVFFLLQILCYTISFYVLIWCFWYSQDFPLSTYRIVAFLLAFLLALSSIYGVRYISSNTINLKSKIKYVMNLMINKAVDKGHIKDEAKYENEIIFPALKKLDE